MTSRQTWTTPLATLLALALLAGAASAQDPGATVTETADAVVLANGAVTATLQGKTPDLAIARGAANATPAFTHRFAQLVEFRDLDGDGSPSSDEVLAAFDLAGAAGWTVATNGSGTDASANLTRTGPVQVGAGATGALPTTVPTSPPNLTLPDRTATVSLVFTLADEATDVAVDLVVARWPAIEQGDTRLALLMVTGGNVTPDEGLANVTANATSVGALTWAANATGTTAAGEVVDVPVRAVGEAEGENATRLAFVYDAPGLATLAHDGTVGLASPATDDVLDDAGSGPLETVKEAPAPAALVGVLAVAALAVAIGRRS